MRNEQFLAPMDLFQCSPPAAEHMNSNSQLTKRPSFAYNGGKRRGFGRAFFPRLATAVPLQHAHQWAYGRNPAFYDYENVGREIRQLRPSQCVFQRQRCDELTFFSWYYIDANQKSPSWTGVPYFWNFMTRQAPSVGPVAQPLGGPAARGPGAAELQRRGVPAYAGGGAGDGAHHPGDGTDRCPQLRRRQPALSTYTFQDIRFLHVLGTIRLRQSFAQNEQENRLGGAPLSRFPFFFPLISRVTRVCLAAIRRDSLSMWV